MKNTIVDLIAETPIYVSGSVKDVKSKDIVSRFNEVIEEEKEKEKHVFH